MLPLLLAGAGAQLIGGYLGHRANRRANSQYDQIGRDIQSRLGGAQAQAQQSRNAYQSAIDGIDPERYFNQAMTGQSAILQRNFAQQNAQRLSGLNARGMLRSDVGGDRQRQDFNRQLGDSWNANAFQAAALGQNKAQMYGNLYGVDQGQSNQFLESLYGLRAAQAQGTANQGNQWAQIFSSLGGGLGNYAAARYQ